MRLPNHVKHFLDVSQNAGQILAKQDVASPKDTESTKEFQLRNCVKLSLICDGWNVFVSRRVHFISTSFQVTIHAFYLTSSLT
jgi:hypothetical protein